jgi:hypothetical protein
VALVENEGLGVGEGDDGGEQSSDGNGGHERAVGVEGVDADGSLAHVNESLFAQEKRRSAHNLGGASTMAMDSRAGAHLSDPDHEQTIGLLAVIASELTKHLRQPGVVGSSADKTHRENCINGDLEVVVVRVPREGVHDGEDGVGGAQHAESERNCSSDDGLAVVHLKGGER